MPKCPIISMTGRWTGWNSATPSPFKTAVVATIQRKDLFTNTTEIYTGVSNTSRVNIGLVFQVRANTYGGANALDALGFEDNGMDTRSGLTTLAPSIRVQPFADVGNFSLTLMPTETTFPKSIPPWASAENTNWPMPWTLNSPITILSGEAAFKGWDRRLVWDWGQFFRA